MLLFTARFLWLLDWGGRLWWRLRWWSKAILWTSLGLDARGKAGTSSSITSLLSAAPAIPCLWRSEGFEALLLRLDGEDASAFWSPYWKIVLMGSP